MEKEFEIWTEGYIATGEKGEASYHGTFKGKTFKDAIIAWKNTIKDYFDPVDLDIDVDKMTWWGCRIFDNEADARKSFG